ncbi:Transcriptional regulator, Cro/CI family protein [Minicystis rosea]|nr:Transcriptional regulator, Cro/CI family protein [Minicystis rosea]
MAHVSKLGELLRHWRQQRGMSQLDLACQAEVSAKHVSFVETGRSVPSREMVLLLARVLDVPLRERNTLLEAAGYVAAYRETAMHAQEMQPVRRALELLLKAAEPFGAVVIDRRWDVVMVSRSYARLLFWLGATSELLPSYVVLPVPRLNAVTMLRGPLGRSVVNREAVLDDLVDRLSRELRDDRDPARQAVLKALMAEREGSHAAVPNLIVPVELRLPTGQIARMFSTIATVGTPQDITVQELRVETFHPADDETDRLVRQLASMFDEANASLS